MKIQAVRGMQDILPARRQAYREIEDVSRGVLAAYGYEEVGLPYLEQTELFRRVVGEHTDIVEKEMYTFDDRNGDSLTLRPEGTAGCVRFAGENGLLFNQVRRLWYGGAMFRHERPQKGRYRQFEQIGAECFGMAGPDIDAELLLMNARIWKGLGLADDIRLELNSLGNPESRERYRAHLVSYLSGYEQDLDADSRRRLNTNPLRILDSKSEQTRAILQGAPVLSDFIDNESRRHFEELRQLLEDNHLDYELNPGIVRGLDYYNKTVFEWTTTVLGAQGAVCGGGRYDGLVAQLGGKPSPGAGFAMGLDRLALMLDGRAGAPPGADVYVVSQGAAARARALQLAERVRDAGQSMKVVVYCGDGKFRTQLKKADASGARIALILGEEEVAAGTVGVKLLRQSGEQRQCPQSEAAAYCLSRLEGAAGG